MSIKECIFRPKNHFALKKGWINDPNIIYIFNAIHTVIIGIKCIGGMLQAMI